MREKIKPVLKAKCNVDTVVSRLVRNKTTCLKHLSECYYTDGTWLANGHGQFDQQCTVCPKSMKESPDIVMGYCENALCQNSKKRKRVQGTPASNWITDR